MPRQHYSAPLGKPVKLITAVAYCLLTLVTAAIVLSLQAGMPRPAGWAVLAVIGTMVLASFTLRVHGYALTDNCLVIRYGLWRRLVANSEMISVTGNASEIFRGSTRLCASGGWWSFLGVFRKPGTGKFKAYVSDISKSVLIVTASDRVVISPADPERFIADLRQEAPQLQGPQTV